MWDKINRGGCIKGYLFDSVAGHCSWLFENLATEVCRKHEIWSISYFIRFPFNFVAPNPIFVFKHRDDLFRVRITHECRKLRLDSDLAVAY